MPGVFEVRIGLGLDITYDVLAGRGVDRAIPRDVQRVASTDALRVGVVIL